MTRTTSTRRPKRRLDDWNVFYARYYADGSETIKLRTIKAENAEDARQRFDRSIITGTVNCEFIEAVKA